MENDVAAAAVSLHEDVVKFHVSVSNHLKALRERRAQLYARIGLHFEDPASLVSPERGSGGGQGCDGDISV
jgi:hypothetical protein